MATYVVNQVVETARRLRGTGFNINDEWIGSLLLAGLPEKYSPMIMAIEHSGIAITEDSIKTKLLDMEIDVEKAGCAFAGKGKRRLNVGNSVGNSVGNVENYVKGKQSNVKRELKEVQCYRCKQMGHYKSNCPNAKQNSSDQKQSNVFSAVFLAGEFNKNEWYVDSGASNHLTVNRHWLTSPCVPGSNEEIIVANKSKVTVECAGNLDITTIVNDKSYKITVKDALCVPQLTTNLLSVSQLIKNGNKVVFNEHGCKIFNKQRELVGVAELVDSVYKLMTTTLRPGFIATVSTATGETWHCRLGHINNQDLLKMQEGAVQGLKCKGDMKIGRQNCIACNEGKQTRLPFPRRGTRASSLLDVIHTDVCGPMEVISVGGAKYFLILEDDFSRMAFVYFLKTKDEAFDKFQEFKNMVENQKNCSIKILRSDNGGEFCGDKFEKFLRKEGIIHQKTNPYTPEQNGSSERMNRTVLEKARCLLFDANLHKRFWAEAVNTAVYLRNRSIASGLNEKTPIEVWTGRKPNVNHLRIFGSKVMVHIPKEKRMIWQSAEVFSNNVTN